MRPELKRKRKCYLLGGLRPPNPLRFIALKSKAPQTRSWRGPQSDPAVQLRTTKRRSGCFPALPYPPLGRTHRTFEFSTTQKGVHPKLGGALGNVRVWFLCRLRQGAGGI